MEDSTKYQQMQDEMSRFEAEISGGDPINPGMRTVIGAGTFDAVQQRLERGPMPSISQPMMQPYEPSLIYPTVPPPPPPPSIMVPAQVQRLRPPASSDSFPPPMPYLRPGLPGPQLIPPPPPKPQPVVLSAAPKLYKQPKEDEDKKEKHESRKRKRSKERTPPPAPAPEPTPPPPPPAPVIAVPEAVTAKPKKEKKNRKVVRTAGGQVWEDVTLLDWPDDDFRMFCGDLGNDVTDELLTRTFSKYSSFQRAKVIRDKRTNKSKGFGFVSFKDPGDFIKAMKEMDGRYVGSRPIKLRKSTWKNRSLDVVRKKEKEKAALLSLLMSGNKS
ncbi:RNA-binding protein 42 isoform X2 [Manduca sexta]|uniref:RNA-binding protein 42 n=1 Tax=Manduca sexta TaxID=7130 RepID=A0A922CG87_MANSE|nr:RNA-binding protein 42 isoform X2 [Manduca sexta]KAG6445685.1 hypothetical protein O3G_MSEX004025 [Manduca sexta]